LKVALANIGEDEMLIAGLDLETGGAKKCKAKDNFITEIGIALYDTDLGDTPVRLFNSLVKNEQRIDPEISEYTGITDAHCDKYGVDAARVAQASWGILSQADMIVAHNGLRFDYPITGFWIDRHIPGTEFDAGKIMCDTMVDVPWDKQVRQFNLTYLAGFHEMYNPFPHRALTDVMTMMKLFHKYPLEHIIASANTEFICAQALVSIAEKDFAKARGFWWEAESKRWLKTMRKLKLDNESPAYEFKYQLVPIPE
jgi:DNA polymerase-3 subunit epsilon